jgi:hypothetical protein
MKMLIYISGITGALLLVFRLLGVFMAFPFNNLLVLAALGMLVLVFLPLYFVDRYRHNKKIREIIQSGKYKQEVRKEATKEDYKVKGWDMNTSPFRERRSGLRWEGGNIKGANAKRGTKRGFLK